MKRVVLLLSMFVAPLVAAEPSGVGPEIVVNKHCLPESLHGLLGKNLGYVRFSVGLEEKIFILRKGDPIRIEEWILSGNDVSSCKVTHALLDVKLATTDVMTVLHTLDPPPEYNAVDHPGWSCTVRFVSDDDKPHGGVAILPLMPADVTRAHFACSQLLALFGDNEDAELVKATLPKESTIPSRR